MKKKSVERKLKRHFQEQTEYLPTLAIEGVTDRRRTYFARRMQKPLLIALTAYLAISIVVIAWIAVRYTDQVDPAAATTQEPNENEEPTFEIRRPSAKQDAIFTMERITDTHSTADFYYDGYKSFEEFISYVDNPLHKPTIIRVRLIDEVAIIPDGEQFPRYETEVQYQIEEIYYLPEEVELEVGDIGTMINYRGIIDGKMWYFAGELPLMDCYEYYLIRYGDDSEKGNVFTYTIPVVDCFEQYEETMNYYGFDVMDVDTIFHNAYPRLKNFIAGSKYWFENEDNLQIIKDRLVEDDNDRYWKNIVNEEYEALISTTLADRIKPDDSIEDVVRSLGSPPSITVCEYYNVLTYYLTEDESQTLEIFYDYVTNKVITVRREYAPTISHGRMTAETVQVGMTYDEVVQIMGAPYYAAHSIEESISSRMKYILTDDTEVRYILNYTQDEPVVTSIVFD